MNENLAYYPDIKIQVEQVGKRGGRRVGFLDELRGTLIILVVLYHLCYDLVYIHGIQLEWFTGKWASAFQLCLSGMFIVASGFSSNLSSRPYARALKVCACAAVISAVTLLSFPSQGIKFGVLHFLGAAMLLYAIFRDAIAYVRPSTGCAVSALLAVASWNIPNGYIGAGALSFPLPEALYELTWLFPLGVAGPDFYSADYFPLFPYIFVFLFGTFAFGLAGAFSERQSQGYMKPIAAAGRHSLLIYMLHQPALMGALFLIMR
ncbi:MAG: DUF1624 domain-containing protein [Clostridiales Family XIII bacterium]|jgi:uncharacterized membrane protein|nr:DUF1624 domain-containing protein [Clostridiales Family XIII bacterium]